MYARPVAKRGQGADVMVEGKTLLVLLLSGRCQHPARVHSQPRRYLPLRLRILKRGGLAASLLEAGRTLRENMAGELRELM